MTWTNYNVKKYANLHFSLLIHQCDHSDLILIVNVTIGVVIIKGILTQLTEC